MRPRINKFGKITLNELHNYLEDNYVFGFTAKRNGDVIDYVFLMMFRDNHNKPEELYIKISNISKLVIKATTNKGKVFNNVEELKQYTKKI